MRRKSWYFALSCGAALLWLALSSVLALPWLRYVAGRLPGWYALLVIMGIALLPGYLMCAMFLSNLLHARPKPPAGPYREPVTVLICARNEAMGIYRTIAQVAAQGYAGTLEILCVDNGSTDGTQEEIRRAMADLAGPERIIRLLTCEQKGKANALNAGLRQVHTRYLITVDADTLLDKNAVDRMLRRIHHSGAACVAGNLLVKDPANAVQKMQIYDYLISIAAIKRFQGSYGSTLVAQGAFSAYDTDAVRRAGGWEQCAGEDIVLTYRLLAQGRKSLYEPAAIGYTEVPHTLGALCRQRIRWARGMFDGLRAVAPWGQRSFFGGYFESLNLSIIFLDVAFIFGFWARVVLLCLGRDWLVGWMTLWTLPGLAINGLSVYAFQRRQEGAVIAHSAVGLLCFALAFQTLQSLCSLAGYAQAALQKPLRWK